MHLFFHFSSFYIPGQLFSFFLSFFITFLGVVLMQLFLHIPNFYIPGQLFSLFLSFIIFFFLGSFDAPFPSHS